jgi:hypothetical protein
MIGKAASAKMREKMATFKRKRDDDEVKSSDSHGTFDGEDAAGFKKQSKKHTLLDDPFLQVDEP